VSSAFKKCQRNFQKFILRFFALASGAVSKEYKIYFIKVKFRLNKSFNEIIFWASELEN